MKKLLITLSFSLLSTSSYGFFGNPADTLALAKLLINSIEQLVRLKQIVDSGKQNIEMIRNINSGIDSAISMMKTTYPELNSSLFKNWDDVDTGMKELERLYGKSKFPGRFESLGMLDRAVVEAIVMNNKIGRHSGAIDQIGEQIKLQSNTASPKGAAKLTAQSLGVLLHVENENLRVQSASLRLQAQQMAKESQKEKEEINFFIETSNTLKSALQERRQNYITPRFK